MVKDKESNMKRTDTIKIVIAAALFTCSAWANEWYDPDTGYTWTYYVHSSGTQAQIGSGISPKPKGALTIPSTIEGHTVTGIGGSAFYNCTEMTSVTIPDGVTSIEDDAFRGCSSMRAVAIPDSVTKIGYQAFQDCVKLADAPLPAGLTILGGGAFRGCINLESINIPSGITFLGGTFEGCSSLTSVTIPWGITRINGDFGYCVGLRTVTIADSVQEISNSSFIGCTHLESVNLPVNLKVIGQYAFQDCNVLSDVVLPSGLEKLGWNAFKNCVKLKNVTIPASLAEHGMAPFEGSGITDAVISEGLEDVSYLFQGCEYLTSISIPSTARNISHICSGCERLPRVQLPEGLAVIGDGAFSGCKRLEEIDFPTGIVSIGIWAFSTCERLTSVLIPNSVTEIDNYAFSDCLRLQEVSLPTLLRSLGTRAFSGCKVLRELTFPEGFMTFGTGASDDYGQLYGCTSLECLKLPSTLESIEGILGTWPLKIDLSEANPYFAITNHCLVDRRNNSLRAVEGGVEHIVIPDGVTAIPRRFLYFDSYSAPGYHPVKAITFPEGLIEIGEYAFNNCRALEEIKLPSTLDIIRHAAFNNTPSLLEIVLPENLTTIEMWNFDEAHIVEFKAHSPYLDNASFGHLKIAICHGYSPIGPGRDSLVSYSRKTLIYYPREYAYDYEDWVPLENFGGYIPSENDPVIVHFDPCDEAIAPPKDYKFTEVAQIGTLPSCNRPGYELEGWFTKETYGEQIDVTYRPLANVTFYAHWKAVGDGNPDPVTPTPITPEPVTPDPVTPGPVTPDPVEPEPVSPTPINPTPAPPKYEVIEANDIVLPYAVPKSTTLQGAVYDGDDVIGLVELKLGKVNANKGTSKVSGSVMTLNGKKHTIKAHSISEIDGVSSVAVSLDVKDFGKMEVTIGGTLFAGSMGSYHVQSANIGGAWTERSATVTIDADDLSMFAGTVLSDLLPDAEQASVSSGKWKFAKAASVKWAKPKRGTAQPEIYNAASGKGLLIDDTKGKTNLSGLKLTYTPKKGTFKGSFKVYTLDGTGKALKLKKYTVNVNGLVVDGVGYGTATCKKPILAWPVTVR